MSPVNQAMPLAAGVRLAVAVQEPSVLSMANIVAVC
jgi:hypothetical protein